MEDTYGCNLINTKRDGRQVKEFVGKYHVHVLVRQGQMTFSDGKNSFTSRQGQGSRQERCTNHHPLAHPEGLLRSARLV